MRAPQGINSCEDFEQALLLGNTYVNVHSTANPGGEIRGQLVRTSKLAVLRRSTGVLRLTFDVRRTYR